MLEMFKAKAVCLSVCLYTSRLLIDAWSCTGNGDRWWCTGNAYRQIDDITQWTPYKKRDILAGVVCVMRQLGVSRVLCV